MRYDLKFMSELHCDLSSSLKSNLMVQIQFPISILIQQLHMAALGFFTRNEPSKCA